MAKKPKPSQINRKAIIAELSRRKAQLEEDASKPSFSFDTMCFEAQRSFFRGNDTNRFKVVVASRRSGKTVGIAADMIDTCLTERNVTCLYLTLTQQNARNIIWGDIQRIIDDYQLDCKLDNTRLTGTFKNGSRFVLSGAKDKQEIEKYRGWKLRKCYIDEAQSFRPYLKELINDIITPALRDLRGELYITGTPGPIPAGVYYDISTSDFWDSYHWTAFENPFMHDPPQKDLNVTLTEERTMKGISERDPGYRRETFGEWIEDPDSLVFKYSKSINHFDLPPTLGNWDYIIGVDIGYEDADAIAVLGYNDEQKRVYLIEEHVNRRDDITGLVERMKPLIDRYKPIKVVMDAGALGKKVQEEIRKRHGVNIEAADKQRKIEFIELMNADLRRAMLMARENSNFAEDCMLVQWDKDKSTSDKRVVSDAYHSDITDAVLYAWRECRHFLSSPPEKKPEIGSNDYMDEMERKEAEELERKLNNPQDYALEKSMQEDIDALQSIIDIEDWY